VVELRMNSRSEVRPFLEELYVALSVQHLRPVPVGRLMHDAHRSV
jgi:hypothetical protein